MKRFFLLPALLLTALLTAAPAFAQQVNFALAMNGDEISASDSEFQPGDAKTLDQMLGFPASPKRLPEFVYPVRAEKFQIQGRVTVAYTVNENGRVEDLEVLTGPGGGCKAEVKRVLRAARFEPTLDAQGHPTAVRYVSAVDFRLR